MAPSCEQGSVIGVKRRVKKNVTDGFEPATLHTKVNTLLLGQFFLNFFAKLHLWKVSVVHG